MVQQESVAGSAQPTAEQANLLQLVTNLFGTELQPFTAAWQNPIHLSGYFSEENGPPFLLDMAVSRVTHWRCQRGLTVFAALFYLALCLCIISRP